MADIHNYERRLERTLNNIKNSGEISEKNRETIIQFHDDCISEGLSVCKTERYLFDLFRFAKGAKKDILQLGEKELRSKIADLEKSTYSEHTKQSFKVLLKKFYKWAEGGEEYPQKVKWIKTNLKKNKQKTQKELLRDEDVLKLINQAGSIRDQSLIAVLYESGARIGEILDIKFHDVSFDKFGAKVNITGKTGARTVRLVNSAPYLQSWMNVHPGKSKEDFVWVKSNLEGISYARVSSILKYVAKKSGINKPVNPHNFRHSRATELAQSSNINESQMKNYLGWTQSSKMASVYIHMNDTDDAILKMHGLKKEEGKKEQKMKPTKCVKCGQSNEPTNKFCGLCGMPLDKDEAEKIIQEDTEKQKAEELMNQLMKDEDVKDLIKKKLGTN